MPPEANSGTPAAPAASGDPSPADNGQPSPAAGTTEPTPAVEPEAFSLEEARKLRSENAALRKRAKDAEERLSKIDEESLSELQKSQKRLSELEREREDLLLRMQERTVRTAALEAATALNFRSPALAYRLLSMNEIEFDDKGEPKNIEALLKKVLAADPYLGKANGDFGGGQRGATPDGAPDMNALLRAGFGKG